METNSKSINEQSKDNSYDVLSSSNENIVDEQIIYQKIKQLKEEGNEYYKIGNFDFAITNYMNAIELTTELMSQERSVLHGNIGISFYKLNDLKSAILHSTKGFIHWKISPNTLKLYCDERFIMKKMKILKPPSMIMKRR
ncbi:hypothetical protein HZS_465 [Henneguya salminicola]|nr:hypothetical protein HZS_465 [Henneguya salminicola]